MHMLERQANLGKPTEDLLFRVILQRAGLGLLLVLLLNLALEVSSICIVHDDAKLSFFGLIDFSETDDVRMVQHLQNLCFPQGFLSLLFTHCLDVDLLDDCILLHVLTLD